MKRSLIALATVLTAALCAALPLTWRADWPDAKPVETLVHRGTDVELQPTWFINKAAADTNGWTFTTFCQTNAVGPWFGPMPGAFFSHTNDVGAAFYNVMVRASTPGGQVNYTAFARLRMLDSPGFAPGELPLPVPFIDFSKVVALHAPWTLQTDFSSATNSFSAATNTLSASVASLSAATNTLSAAIGGLAQNLATNYYTAAETDDAIDSLAAYYITYTAAGAAFPTRAALLNATVVYSGGAARTPTRNDYAVVLADESHGGAEWRYIYTVAAGATSGQWDAQYPIETNDYDALANKPQINGVSLSGNKTGAALGLADETTPVVQPPSLSADLFPIVYQNQFGDTLTIESMADVVFEHPGGAYPYELYKSGFYSRICGFQENGVFAGNGGGTVATFNGRNGESYIWPTLTLSATGGSVVRSTDLVAVALAATNYTAAVALAATNYTVAVALAATNYTNASISPTSPAFSNAVLSVGLGIDTNTVAVINELVDSAHDLPVSGATSVGALLLALAAAVAALKKRFHYNLNVITIASSGAATATLADRSINEVTAASAVTSITFTFPPRQTGQARDFFVRLVIQGETVPTLYFNEPNGGGAVAFDADDDSWADIESGVNIMMFTDTAE